MISTRTTFYSEAWETLASLGPAASEALPTLRQRVHESWSDWKVLFFLRCLVHIAPREALVLCEQIWKEEKAVTKKAEYAVHVAYHAGEVDIPILEKVSGFFGVMGAREAPKALRGGYSWPPKRDDY